MNKGERNTIPTQDPKERINNFREVNLGFTEEQMLNEANRCLDCKSQPCRHGCPVGIDIPGFINKLKENKVNEAYDIIKTYNTLPAICGRVCPQENQCEKYCVRNKLGGAVAIGALERYAADFCLKNSTPRPSKIEPLPYKVAVVGSGPASLACAAELARNGVSVTMYEAFHKPGGVLVYGIPEFRLPKDLVRQEIDGLLAMGVNLELNTIIGKTIFLEELTESYDAVFLGTGAGLPVFMGIPGEELNGVYSANEYLTRINLMKAYLPTTDTPIRKGHNVAVIGAGNVAMDSARTAVRMGAKKVYIIYRRTEEDIPARAEEVEHARQEGIEFLTLTAPISIDGDKFVKAITCTKMEVIGKDDKGRNQISAIADSTFQLDCDLVIMALGTSPNPLLKNTTENLVTTERGTIVVSPATNQTSLDWVYAGGDTVTGAATVILAMGAGKNAGNNILYKLKEQKIKTR